jgi:hypothetical protein
MSNQRDPLMGLQNLNVRENILNDWQMKQIMEMEDINGVEILA